MSGPYLVVPVDVQAMVLANPETTLIRGSMEYRNDGFSSPAPAPLGELTAFQKSGMQGVYVTWTLPTALRQGTRQADGSLLFPLVPNRWLVTRLITGGSAPVPSFTIVQSDYLDPNAGTSAYVSPTAPTLTPTLIGRSVPVSFSSPWTEPGAAPTPFLRAVAEANPYFSAWQPFHENVFSFFDPLGQEQLPAGSLSYYVVGWYSEAASDILASWPAKQSLPDFLESLHWSQTTHDDLPRQPLNSIYQGAAFGVDWKPDAQPYVPEGGGTSAVAVGNTSMDGIVAMSKTAIAQATVAQAASAPNTPPTPDETAAVLEAFLYDLLPDREVPGGESHLDDQVRGQWYASTPGDPHYVIVNAPAAPGTEAVKVSPQELATEATWLTKLNTAQSALSQLERKQIGLQRRLYELWWKNGWAAEVFFLEGEEGYPWDTSAAQFTTAIAQVSTQLAHLRKEIAGWVEQVPHATATVTLEQAIATFASGKGLPSTRLLKKKSGDRYWTAADPVIVVSNTSVTPPALPTPLLVCRWLPQLVTETGKSAPELPSANLPAPVTALFAELFLLDPSTGVVPSPGSASLLPAITPPYPWQAPWKPLFLDWEVVWYDIPFSCWEFDGTDYFLPNSVPATLLQPRSFLGRSVLTAKPAFDLGSKIGKYIHDFPDSSIVPLLQRVQTDLKAWTFLSQRLSGLETQIAGWSAVPTQLPDSTNTTSAGSLRDLLGSGPRIPPNPQMADPQPCLPTSPYEGMRAGQFFLNQIAIVDAWGQVLPIVNPPSPSLNLPAPTQPGTDQIFVPETAYGVTPTNSIAFSPPLPNLHSLIELPPRLLQPARLNFDFLPGVSGNPIVGWILPNHLDSALAVYGPEGEAYGELVLGVDALNRPVAKWLPSANSPYPTLPPARVGQSALLGFLAGLVAAGPAALADLLGGVDETLWTVDPLGSRADTFLSVLVGRPLAIVEASLSLELESEPWRDPDWPYTFATPPVDPLFLAHHFPVRLGEVGYREDGLLGYFLKDSFDQFNAVHLPSVGTTSSYLRLIGPAQPDTAANFVNLQFGTGQPGPAAHLLLVVDPRGSVQAQCGLVPTRRVSLASEWVDRALANMSLTFRTGPALVSSGVVPSTTDTPAQMGLRLPRPAERGGTWSWQEVNTEAHWSSLALLPVDATATLADQQPTLREGRLALAGALKP